MRRLPESWCYMGSLVKDRQKRLTPHPSRLPESVGGPVKGRHHRLASPVFRLPSRAKGAGFTLIEILAAFVIFALAFGAVMQALSGSVHNTVQSRGYTQAALMARSKMDRLGITEALEPGGYSGELDEGYRYEMEIREWQPPEGEWADGNLQPQVQLYRVDLRVLWGDEPRVRQAEFSTLRATKPDL